MLILPLQYSFSWKKPPYLTLILIALNICIFAVYQSKDTDRLKEIIPQYKNSGLLHAESPHYITYLTRKALTGTSVNPDMISKLEDDFNEQNYDPYLTSMMLDQEFVEYLDESKLIIWSKQDSEWWIETREHFFQNELTKLSSFALGYIPERFEVTRLFSYQFLHAGLGHLIGNIALLFILGFGLERMVSRLKLLIIYLVTGAIAALSYGILTSGFTPLIGASASISGVMGVYVGLFALQKIKFFYFIFFAFGYFSAPALIILPVWILNELFQLAINDSNAVAYVAHIGGFVCGSLLGWLFKDSWLRPIHDSVTVDQESTLLFRKQYAQALQAVEDLQFVKAQNLFTALWNKNQDKEFLLEHLFHLYKVTPRQKQYHMVVQKLIQHTPTLLNDDTWEVIEDYILKNKNQKLLKQSIRTKVIEAAMASSRIDILEALDTDETQSSLRMRILDTLFKHYKKSVQPARSQEIAARMDRLMD